MNDRPHRSIGEVLTLLKPEYPDVTISKIRFLESQGLIDPERTPSGYRKFFDEDIDRLRWVLAQQRDKFLPLKVIKARIDSGDWRSHDPESDPSSPGALPESATRRSRGGNPLDVGPTSVSMSVEELAATCGLSLDDVAELEKYGLITPTKVGPTKTYDDDALLVGRASAAFLRHGLEVRHLRTYKVAAEREAGILEQLLVPLLKPAQGPAPTPIDALGELIALGSDFRHAMLRAALRNHLRP